MGAKTNSEAEKSRHAEIQRERLLDAASEIFLEHGFGITTVDLIAAQAKASKKTLYHYFSSKEEIYVAAVERLCRQTLAPLHDMDIRGDDPRALLIEFGTRLLAQLLTPQAIALYRLAVSEATRFPEATGQFYRIGPATVQGILGRHLAHLHDQGKLKIENPDETAGLFIQLVLGEFQRKCALAVSPPPTAPEARHYVEQMTDFLLRALR